MEAYQPNRACYCTRCRTRGIMGPAVLITLGVLFLLDNLNFPGAHFSHTWPLILIAIGAVKVLQANASTNGHVPPAPSTPPPAPAVEPQVPPSPEQVNRV